MFLHSLRFFLFYLTTFHGITFTFAQNNCSTLNEYQCSNGDCISKSKKCNGITDCKDNSDETVESCREMICPNKYFHCAYGACVPIASLCNGIKDCADNSDESQCPMFDFSDFCVQNRLDEANPELLNPSWKVPCLSGECIPLHHKCDGISHCSDNSDELFHTCQFNFCPSGTFQCDYGACVPENVTCDGVANCFDNSDETLDRCRNKNNDKIQNICGKNFQCASGLCIDPNHVCNGKRDCDDGSDETYRQCRNIQCEGFQCKYGGCVDLNELSVDSIKTGKPFACVDESDLSFVNTNTNPLKEFVCSNGDSEMCECTFPPQPSNGFILSQASVKNGLVKPGSVLNFYCQEDYSLDSEETIICLNNGSWNSSIPNCLQSCPPMIASNLDITCMKGAKVISCGEMLPHGTVARAQCKHRYESKNSIFSRRMITCKDGSWDDDLPDCSLVCGTSKPIGERLQHDNSEQFQGDYPWNLIVYKEPASRKNKHICSGILISLQYGLSAAHCFQALQKDTNKTIEDPSKFLVGAGKLYSLFNSSEDIHAQIREIARITIPDEYEGRGNYFGGDIAIMMFTKAFEVNNFISPVCIDFAGNVHHGNVVGWKISNGTDYKKNKKLIVITMKHVEKETCFFKFPESAIKYTVFKLCGQSSGQSLCYGSSGAGWTFRKGIYHYVQGVSSASFGSNCANDIPEIFTSIHHHLVWLLKNVLSSAITESNMEINQPTNKNCIIKPHPDNGKYKLNGRTSFKIGTQVPAYSVLQFKCNKGYRIDDNAPVVCVNGQWSRSYPKCLKTCAPLRSNTLIIKCELNGIEVSCQKPMLPNTVASLRCKDAYDIQPPPTYSSSKCINGNWDSPLYSCFPVCGIKSPEGQKFVIGGNDTIIGDFPWHVGLYRLLISDVYNQICGGTIISPRMVLTAAHCFIYSRDSENYGVAAGKYYRQWMHPKDKKAQYLKIHKIVIPDRYQDASNSFAYDIAVLILKTPFTLSHLVRPVCMDWSNQYDDYQLSKGAHGFVAGWGLTTEGGDASEELKSIELPYVSFRDCYENSPADFRPFITNDKFCAGHLTGKAVCEGDSGGGLAFVKDSSIYYLRGIVSVGPGKGNSCDANRYTAFTRVSSHINWIISVDNQNRLPF